MNFDNLAILDVETTGASAPYDRIIEIGVIRIEKNKIVKKFETLINPEVTISPFIENLTGIVGRQLKDAPLFSEIKSDLAELLDGCVLVAHNARFDYSFIRNEYKRIGVPYSAKQLCTVKLSRLLFPNFSIIIWIALLKDLKLNVKEDIEHWMMQWFCGIFYRKWEIPQHLENYKKPLMQS